MDNITLIGMPGSGKSTIGKLLAGELGYSFLDIDRMIESRAGQTLQTVLDQLGVEAFLDCEDEIIRSIRCSRCVLSPGGSAACRETAARHLKSLGPVVYLRVALSELSLRIKNISTRGIAMYPDQTLEQLLAIRTPLYEKYADIIIDCPNGQSKEQTVALALEALNRHNTAQAAL